MQDFTVNAHMHNKIAMKNPGLTSAIGTPGGRLMMPILAAMAGLFSAQRMHLPRESLIMEATRMGACSAEELRLKQG